MEKAQRITTPVESPLNIAIVTVSDTRTVENDTSGATLKTLASEDGHNLVNYEIVRDCKYLQRAVVSRLIAEPGVDVIITTGGTGITGRDVTPEALSPLFDKEIPGFGELFRTLSLQDIGVSTIQSRALAGVANGKFIFCLPGSTGACTLAWERILSQQLDSRFKPCNFAKLKPRTLEQ